MSLLLYARISKISIINYTKDFGVVTESFDPTSGKLLVVSDGNYYLADITDPETLINPFEIAEIQ